MDVAYLVNQYPTISHTFIRREIAALERRGVRVVRFAVRRAKQAVVSEEDRREEARTRYIVGAGAGEIVTAIFASIFAAPGRSLASLGVAMKMGWRSEAGLVRHLIYWVEALVLAAWLRRAGCAHLHAHFGTNSATVALLAAALAGIGY